MTVKATDKDENENGRVTYHLKVDGENVQETNEFIINPNTGELKTKQYLDREIKPKYEVSCKKNVAYLNCRTVNGFITNEFCLQLTLVARDHGYPKWYETLSYLTIQLVDTNDNRPEFPDSKTTNPYHFYVTENNEKDMKLGKRALLMPADGAL